MPPAPVAADPSVASTPDAVGPSTRWLGLPLAQLWLAYAPGGVEVMAILAKHKARLPKPDRIRRDAAAAAPEGAASAAAAASRDIAAMKAEKSPPHWAARAGAGAASAAPRPCAHGAAR